MFQYRDDLVEMFHGRVWTRLEDSSGDGDSCARSRVTCKFSHVAVGQGRGEYAVDKKGDSVDGRAISAGRSVPVTGRM